MPHSNGRLAAINRLADEDEDALGDGTFMGPPILDEPDQAPQDIEANFAPEPVGPNLADAGPSAASTASAASLQAQAQAQAQAPSTTAAPAEGKYELPYFLRTQGGASPFGNEFSSAFQDERVREGRIKDTKRNLALAQNLDLIGRSLAGLRGGVDTTKLSKADSSGLQSDLADAEDEVSQADRDFLRGTVGELPKGMKYSRLKAILPTVASTLQGRERTTAQQKAQEAQQKAQQRAQEGRAGQLATGEARRQKSFERYPIAQAVALKGQKNTLDAIERIKTDKSKVQAAVGPVVGRINKALSQWGASGPEVSQLQAELANVLSTVGKSISGATISDQEMARIKEQLPQMVQRGDTFDSLLERIQTQIKGDVDNAVQIGSDQGYDMAAFKWGGAKSGAKSIRIPANDTQAIKEAQEDGYTVETY